MPVKNEWANCPFSVPVLLKLWSSYLCFWHCVSNLERGEGGREREMNREREGGREEQRKGRREITQASAN